MGESPGRWLIEQEIRRVLLGPNGEPLGKPARKGSKVRRVNGGAEEAEELFGTLAQRGSDASIETYPGERIRLPEIGYVGYRAASKSGPPTVDVSVNIEGLRNVKFKFVGSAGT